MGGIATKFSYSNLKRKSASATNSDRGGLTFSSVWLHNPLTAVGRNNVDRLVQTPFYAPRSLGSNKGYQRLTAEVNHIFGFNTSQ